MADASDTQYIFENGTDWDGELTIGTYAMVGRTTAEEKNLAVAGTAMSAVAAALMSSFAECRDKNPQDFADFVALAAKITAATVPAEEEAASGGSDGASGSSGTSTSTPSEGDGSSSGDDSGAGGADSGGSSGGDSSSDSSSGGSGQ